MFNKLINTNAGSGGGIAFVNTDVNFRSLDVSDPSNISQLSSVTVTTGDTGYSNGGIAIDRDNNVAYTVNSSNTLTAIDISDPSNLSILDTLVIGTVLSDVVVDTTTSVAYVSNRLLSGAGIYSIDISNPSNMSVLQAYDGGSYYTGNLKDIDIDIINKKLVLCNQYYYTYVLLDISNPSSISNITAVSKGQSPTSAKYNSDGTKIFTVGERTVEIFSSSLGLISHFTSQDDIYYADAPIEVNENFNNFYLGGRVSGQISSFDTSDSALTSSLTGFTDVMGLAIDLENNIIYATELAGNVKAIQIVDKNNMSLLSTFNLTNAANTKRIALY